MEMPDEAATHFKYRGEGAANIVLSYSGPESQFNGKILRIRKTFLSDKANDSSDAVLSSKEKLVWSDFPEVVNSASYSELIHSFSKYVMQPLLGVEFVDPGQPVTLSRKFMEETIARMQSNRPKNRIEKAGFQPAKAVGLLISDHSTFPEENDSEPSLCIELKPKCGFLPELSSVSPAYEIKTRVTRFQMHQHLKLSQNEVKELSKYNPLDFFSGQPEIIFATLERLFLTPQNNFRIFKNGKQLSFQQDRETPLLETQNVSGNDGKSSWGSIESDLEDFFPYLPGNCRVKKLLSLISRIVADTVAVPNLLKCQKLDNKDIENAFLAFKKFDSGEIEDVEALEECRKTIRDYLISATAKDCGLMIALRRNGGSSSTGAAASRIIEDEEFSDQSFECKVSFLDLDMKPYKKMPYYFELDQKVVKHYLESESL